jgi:hypothetical protein
MTWPLEWSLVHDGPDNRKHAASFSRLPPCRGRQPYFALIISVRAAYGSYAWEQEEDDP